ncbi:hypothetical protein YC2023_089908 [Brassica napus]
MCPYVVFDVSLNGEGFGSLPEQGLGSLPEQRPTRHRRNKGHLNSRDFFIALIGQLWWLRQHRSRSFRSMLSAAGFMFYLSCTSVAWSMIQSSCAMPVLG